MGASCCRVLLYCFLLCVHCIVSFFLCWSLFRPFFSSFHVVRPHSVYFFWFVFPAVLPLVSPFLHFLSVSVLFRSSLVCLVPFFRFLLLSCSGLFSSFLGFSVSAFPYSIPLCFFPVFVFSFMLVHELVFHDPFCLFHFVRLIYCGSSSVV